MLFSHIEKQKGDIERLCTMKRDKNRGPAVGFEPETSRSEAGVLTTWPTRCFSIFFSQHLLYLILASTKLENIKKNPLAPGVILELSDREKFCDNFREKFESKFWISLYILHIFTSPSAQDREKSASLGRPFLPNCPLG